MLTYVDGILGNAAFDEILSEASCPRYIGLSADPFRSLKNAGLCSE